MVWHHELQPLDKTDTKSEKIHLTLTETNLTWHEEQLGTWKDKRRWHYQVCLPLRVRGGGGKVSRYWRVQRSDGLWHRLRVPGRKWGYSISCFMSQISELSWFLSMRLQAGLSQFWALLHRFGHHTTLLDQILPYAFSIMTTACFCCTWFLSNLPVNLI